SLASSKDATFRQKFRLAQTFFASVGPPLPFLKVLSGYLHLSTVVYAALACACQALSVVNDDNVCETQHPSTLRFQPRIETWRCESARHSTSLHNRSILKTCLCCTTQS